MESPVGRVDPARPDLTSFGTYSDPAEAQTVAQGAAHGEWPTLRRISPTDFAGIFRQAYPDLSVETDDDHLLTHAVLTLYPDLKADVNDVLEGAELPGGPYAPPEAAPLVQATGPTAPGARRLPSGDIELPPPPGRLFPGRGGVEGPKRQADIELPAPPDPMMETTPLSREEEAQFQQWVAANRTPDVDNPLHHYDYRGLWKAKGQPGGRYETGAFTYGVDHFPDTWKRSTHPTFSAESIYAPGGAAYRRTPRQGGDQRPGHWINQGTPNERFVPSPITPTGLPPAPIQPADIGLAQEPLPPSLPGVVAGEQLPSEFFESLRERIAAGAAKPVLSPDDLERLRQVDPEAALYTEAAPMVVPELLQTPVLGPLQIGQGASQLGEAMLQTTVGQPPPLPAWTGGLANVGRGAFATSTLLIPAGIAGAAQPVRAALGTVVGITAGSYADNLMRRVSEEKLGLSPETSDLIGLLSGLATGVRVGTWAHQIAGIPAALGEAATAYKEAKLDVLSSVVNGAQQEAQALLEAEAARVRANDAARDAASDKRWETRQRATALGREADEAASRVQAMRHIWQGKLLDALRQLTIEKGAQTRDLYVRAWLNRLTDRFGAPDASAFQYLDRAVRGPHSFLNQIAQISDGQLQQDAANFHPASGPPGAIELSSFSAPRRTLPPKGPSPTDILGAPPGWKPPPGPIIESTTASEVSGRPPQRIAQTEAVEEGAPSGSLEEQLAEGLGRDLPVNQRPEFTEVADPTAPGGTRLVRQPPRHVPHPYTGLAPGERELLDGLIADAYEEGFTGTDAELTALKQRLADRWRFSMERVGQELNADFAESGHNPTALLQAVAEAGGLTSEKEIDLLRRRGYGGTTGYHGELEWLREHVESPQHGRVRGVHGVFWSKAKRGLTVDGMVEALRQDPRFEWITDTTVLLDALRDAVAGRAAPEFEAGFTENIKALGENWWNVLLGKEPAATTDIPPELRGTIEPGTQGQFADIGAQPGVTEGGPPGPLPPTGIPTSDVNAAAQPPLGFAGPRPFGTGFGSRGVGFGARLSDERGALFPNRPRRPTRFDTDLSDPAKVAEAKRLYLERVYLSAAPSKRPALSMIHMAVALRDAGIRLPENTKAARITASARIRKLMEATESEEADRIRQGHLDPASPFASRSEPAEPAELGAPPRPLRGQFGISTPSEGTPVPSRRTPSLDEIRQIEEAGLTVEPGVKAAAERATRTAEPGAPPPPIREEQPTLPGLESVRETETPTPAFEAPFTLTPEAAPTTEKEPSLFDRLKGEEGAINPNAPPRLLGLRDTPTLTSMRKWADRNRARYGDSDWFTEVEDALARKDGRTAFKIVAMTEHLQTDRPVEVPRIVPGEQTRTATGQFGPTPPPQYLEPSSPGYAAAKAHIEATLGTSLPTDNILGVDETGTIYYGDPQKPLRASATNLLLARSLVGSLMSKVDPTQIIRIEGNQDTRLRLFRQMADQIVRGMPEELVEEIADLTGLKKPEEPLTAEHRAAVASHFTRFGSEMGRGLRLFKDWQDANWQSIVHLTKEALGDDPDVIGLSAQTTPNGFLKWLHTEATADEMAILAARGFKLPPALKLKTPEGDAWAKRWWRTQRQREIQAAGYEKTLAELSKGEGWADRLVIAGSLERLRGETGDALDITSNLSLAFSTSQLATAERNAGGQGLAYNVAIMNDVFGAGAALTTGNLSEAARLGRRAGHLMANLTRPGKVAPLSMLRHPFTQSMDVVYNLARTQLKDLPARDVRRVISVINESPQHAARFLGATQWEERGRGSLAEPAGAEGVAVGGLQAKPLTRTERYAHAAQKVRNFVTVFSRIQEAMYRSILANASFRSQLSERGVDPDAFLGMDDPYQALVDKFGVDVVDRMSGVATAASLSGTFAAAPYPGSIPAVLMQVFNNTQIVSPVVKMAYPFPRFNLINAPRFIYDQSPLGLFELPLYAANKYILQTPRWAPGGPFKGRLYRGLEAAKIEQELIPKLTNQIAGARFDMAKATQDYLSARLEGRQHAHAYDALVRRSEKTATMPDEIRAAMDTVGRQMVEKVQLAIDAETRLKDAAKTIKEFQRQQTVYEKKVMAATEAGMPKTIQEYWGRQASGAAMLGAAMLLRWSGGAEDTKWYEYRFGGRKVDGQWIGGHTYDFRALAPFVQFLLPADMIVDAMRHTDHAEFTAAREKWFADHPDVSRWDPTALAQSAEQALRAAYHGKYTGQNALNEMGSAFLSMSRAAGVSSTLIDWWLKPQEGVPREGTQQQLISALLATVGQFVGRAGIPLQMGKDIAGQFLPEEAKARIPQEPTPEHRRYAEQLYEPFVSHVPGLGRVIPEKINPLTGEPIAAVNPGIRALFGLTERDRNWVEAEINRTGTPFRTFALRQTGDREVDNQVAKIYAGILGSSDIKDDLFGSEEYRTADPDSKRDIISKYIGRVKLQTYADAGEALGLTDEQTIEKFGPPAIAERRKRMERLQRQLETLTEETLQEDHPQLRQELEQEQREQERQYQQRRGGPPPPIGQPFEAQFGAPPPPL